MKSTEEMAELKRQWLADPAWDIEDTEGFEEHHEELLRWRKEEDEAHRRKHIEHVTRRARNLGCTVMLVEYVETLEYQIESLSRAIARLEMEMERRRVR